MNITRRDTLKFTAAALASSALPQSVFAQAWPTRGIRAMVPFAAGSSLDIIGRIVLDPLATQLGQSIVVENRGGAGGSIGTAQVAKSDPDGYTILIQASAHSAAPAAYPNIAYDPAKDFIAVIPFGTVPNVLVVAPGRDFKSATELAAAARANPGKFTYASAGVGSATHWAAERYRMRGGFQAVHVPFRGGPEALTEVMTGRVDFTCMGISAALPLIRDKKLVALAVSTPKRSSALPEVPTTLELGLKIPTTSTGWGCSSRPRRRRRSSRSSGPRPPRRCRTRTWSRSSRGRASSRCRCHPSNSTR